MPVFKRRCTKCLQIKESTEFHRNRNGRNGRQGHCKSCHFHLWSGRTKSTPRLRILLNSKRSAKDREIFHDIDEEDITLPEKCPYLGIDLDYSFTKSETNGRRHNAPALDRINTDRGYVEGNVQVISDLANRMKSNASIEQLLCFARSVIRIHEESN